MRWGFKRLLFFLIRLQSEISLFEGPRRGSGESLRMCYVGSLARGRQFIEQIYGYAPEGRVIGRCLSARHPRRLEKYHQAADVVMIEINRLFLDPFVEARFFPIPEWVEFERSVVRDARQRYAGASKSLKSDLNRIKKGGYRISISHDMQDFEAFYRTMYLPSIQKRYRNNAIVKPRRRLKKDFSSGFLMLLFDGDLPAAGAIVSVGKDVVRETTIGIAGGSEETLRGGASGILDYHIHAWAADHGKTVMNVGHTRPYPSDGVYFNKRKWLMRIVPDRDGVANFAVRFNLPDRKAAALLDSFPFIFQTKNGLHLLCSLNQPEPAASRQIQALRQRLWTEGLRSMSVLAPAGLCPEAGEYVRGSLGASCRLISELKEARFTGDLKNRGEKCPSSASC
jgi:hypothetical protein